MSLNAPTLLEGKVRPTSNTLTQVMVIDTSVKFATLQIMAINDQTSGDTTIKVAISNASTPGNVQSVDYIETGDIIKPHGKVTIFGILVGAGQRVFVQSANSNTNFRVTGLAHLN